MATNRTAAAKAKKIQRLRSKILAGKYLVNSEALAKALITALVQ